MKINRLILKTAAIDKLDSFYSRTLELETKRVSASELQINCVRSELIFKQAPGDNPFYHFAFNIPSNKIEEARSWLKNKVDLIWMDDYKSDIADFVNWKAKSVYFFDPAGNIVELIARFDLNNPALEPFSGKQILSVSEVGLVFSIEGFAKKTNALLRDNRLEYFLKQPALPQFRAIGDDEGLFIVVPEKRNWYPTEKASGIFPIQVEFENGGSKFKLRI